MGFVDSTLRAPLRSVKGRPLAVQARESGERPALLTQQRRTVVVDLQHTRVSLLRIAWAGSGTRDERR